VSILPAKMAPAISGRHRAVRWSRSRDPRTTAPFAAVTLQPGLQLGALAVGLLTLGGRYADIDACVHANWSTPYFTGCPARIKVKIDAGLREGKERLPYFAGCACAKVREFLLINWIVDTRRCAFRAAKRPSPTKKSQRDLSLITIR
jgi:hypothetical protein